MHLVKVEGAVTRSVTGARAGAAGRRAFDHIGTGPHDPADDWTDIRQAVDDTVRQQWIIGLAA